MSQVSTAAVIDADDLARRLSPRDDHLVLEAVDPELPAPEGPVPPSGEAGFVAVHGPFARYRRTITWATEGGRVHIRQVIDFRSSIVFFGPLYTPLLRRALPDGLAPGRQVWWATPDRLSPGQARSMSAMCIISTCAGLLYACLTNVLTFASAEIGSGTASEQANLTAATRIGAVIPLVLMAFADRIGRRRVAVGCSLAAVLLSVASAVSPSLLVLGVLQTLARNLAVTAGLAADTIVVEDLPPGSRATAAALGALSWGAGAGAVIFLLPLADTGVGGWRLVFAASVVTLPLVVLAARNLPESRRFLHVEAVDPGRRSRVRPGRFALLAAIFFLVNAVVAPGSQLQNDYLRVDRGFDAATISLFVVLTGAPAFLGILAGTRMADRRGRRKVLPPTVIAIGVFFAAFYLSSGPTMWVVAAVGGILGAASVPALGVLAPELFPTAKRGRARGAVTSLATVGSAAGLVVAGAMVDRVGYGQAFTWLALAPITAGLLCLLVPETKGLELEELNEDLDTGHGNGHGNGRDTTRDTAGHKEPDTGHDVAAP
jgi:putative MFS transporter